MYLIASELWFVYNKKGDEHEQKDEGFTANYGHLSCH